MGHAKALYNLGVLYAVGKGVPQDLVETLRWFELSANAGLGAERDLANRALVETRERITPAQVQDARRLAEAWKRETGTVFADMRSPTGSQARPNSP